MTTNQETTSTLNNTTEKKQVDLNLKSKFNGSND